MPPFEYLEPISILDDFGQPIKGGWARQPHFLYHRSDIRGPLRRIVESDRYIILSRSHALSFEIMDAGHLGYISIIITDLDKGSSVSDFVLINFPLGTLTLPEALVEETVKVQHKQLTLDFVAMKEGARIIKVNAPGFNHGIGLRGAVVLTPPPSMESIATLMPWRKYPKAFRYSLRAPWYSVEGMMQSGDRDMAFQAGKAWGILDWNRGIIPCAEIRYWAAACGMVGSRRISFTVGYGNADSSGGSENAIFVDGILHKLGQVTFRILPKDWHEPWSFSSDDKRFSVSFIPKTDVKERVSVLFHTRKRRLFFGFFSGTLVLDNGTTLDFTDLPGLGEQVKARI